MKVIEFGHIKPLYTQCKGCGSVLEFYKREASLSPIHLHRGPANDGYDYYITCIACGRKIHDLFWKSDKDEVYF